MGRYRDESEGMTVLDRLMWQPPRADDIGSGGDPLIDSIANDLEALMNSRREDQAIPEEYPEVGASVLNFGMPALGRYGNLGTAAEQNRLCRAMEEAIRTFEPRLKRAQVRVAEPDTGQRSVVRFRLEATIAGLGDETVQREIFELRLKPETGEMTVAAGA